MAQTQFHFRQTTTLTPEQYIAFVRSAWALIGAWGDRSFHLKRVDAAVLGDGFALGPDETFNSETTHA